MMRNTILFTFAVLASPAVLAFEEVQQVQIQGERDSEWAAYRHAYKAAGHFEPFVRNRPLIQAHMQVRPMRPEASMEGLKLQVLGERTRLDIAVDGIGRAVLPMDKAAYEDDAVIKLNRQKGQYYFSGRYSLKERDDGIYPADDLRAGCEQLISAQRESGYRMRLLFKNCAGVKLVYAKGSAPTVLLRLADGSEQTLATTPGHPFEDRSMGLYDVVQVRFADLPPAAEVRALTRPLAIGTVYD